MELKTFRFALSTLTSSNGTDILLPGTTYLPVETAFLFLIAGSVSLGTIIGNILVMLSIIINRSLQTINSYYLFSLAFADLIIGVTSMNLYTTLHCHHWLLAPRTCCVRPMAGPGLRGLQRLRDDTSSSSASTATSASPNRSATR